MLEPLQVLLTVLATLMVIASVASLLFCLVLVPLVALGALPTYASMIGLEVFIDRHFGRRCPSVLRFKRPQTFAKKFWMNAFASLTTLVGALIALEVGELAPGRYDLALGTGHLVERASQPLQFGVVAMFWVMLGMTYAVSNWHHDDPNDAMNKFEWLSLPEWAGKVISKLVK